jgi:hypothetical protein
MAYELDEGLPHRLADGRVRRDDVRHREQREQQPDPHDFQGLQHHVFAPEARKTLVPDRGQQLLHVGVRHELQSMGLQLINAVFLKEHPYNLKNFMI